MVASKRRGHGMAERYDAVIIGAGVIGAAVGAGAGAPGPADAQLDALPAAGYGSTSALGRGDPGLLLDPARHRPRLRGLPLLAATGPSIWACPTTASWRASTRCGSVVIKTEDNQRAAAGLRAAWPSSASRSRTGTRRGCAASCPSTTLQRFAPPRRPDDPAFGDSDGEIAGAVFFPTCGYVNDPQLAARNLQRAAEAHGGRFRFNAKVAEIRRAGGRVAGRDAGRRHGRSTRRWWSTSPGRTPRSSTAWPASRPRWRYARGRCGRRWPRCRPRRASISARGR